MRLVHSHRGWPEHAYLFSEREAMARWSRPRIAAHKALHRLQFSFANPPVTRAPNRVEHLWWSWWALYRRTW